MHEALYQFIRAHYMEILAILPMMLLLTGLVIAVGIDPYIQKRQKRIMLMICALVFSLIAQNELDHLLTIGRPMVMLRRMVDIYGYSIRPVILLLFLYIVSSEKNYGLCWVLIGVNAAIHMTALFTDICFTIDSDNMFQGGWPVVKNSCLLVSLILLALLLYFTFRDYLASKRKEAWIPAFAVFTTFLALLMDASVADTPQPVSFLTISIVISSVLYYIWLHFQFVRAHERALAAEQRIQIMMTQIQPHFLYNTLATIRSLCLRSPETAAQTIDKFSRFLRQNLDMLDHVGLIPFSQELEHVRIYTEIEMLMFPYIHICYDIEGEDFLLPTLSVQPLVENAIRHGVRAREVGQICIQARESEEGHTITIQDNGLGFDPAAIEASGEKHIGIRNVRERLEKQCGGTLQIESQPGTGTVATLFVPYTAADKIKQ
ncbi:MAG: histidine kinase [Oscillospiraceae bacterium]|nr:histidine kinase [Oscillospiraceae bacterium]